MNQDTKRVAIAVGIGFLFAGLLLGFMKRRFGIEIGDPVDIPNDDDTNPNDEE